MPDEPIIAFSKVKDRGHVPIPAQIRRKLKLQPGVKMMVYAPDDAVILRKADVMVEKEATPGIVKRLRSMFSKESIRDIED